MRSTGKGVKREAKANNLTLVEVIRLGKTQLPGQSRLPENCEHPNRWVSKAERGCRRKVRLDARCDAEDSAFRLMCQRRAGTAGAAAWLVASRNSQACAGDPKLPAGHWFESQNLRVGRPDCRYCNS